MRLLIVEDDEEFRRELGEFLAAQEHEVAYAANVPQALHQMEALHPDAVLVDLMLPVFDGNDLAATIRAQSSAQPRLIAITGVPRRADPDLFDAVIGKPIVGDALLRLLSPGPLPPRRTTGKRRRLRRPS